MTDIGFRLRTHINTEVGGLFSTDYLNELPTSFVLTDEAVDRLRAGAAKALMNSPDFKRLVADTNIQIVESPTTATAPANRQ